MEMRTDPTTDVVEKNIDRIITEALLFASNVNESGLRNMYNDSRLHELFFERIWSLIFENDIELKTWFESSEVASGVFKKLINTANNYPLCEDCANDLPCDLCSLVIGDFEQYQIDKSFKNFDKKSYNNGIHSESSDGYATRGKSCPLSELSDRFVKHVVNIVRYLTKYLELFCLDGGLLENKVEELTNVNNENVNDNVEHDHVNHDMNDGSHISQKSCVVLFCADKTQLSKFKLCFKSDKISWKEGQETTISSSFGYMHMPYMDNEEECNKICTEINTYIKLNFRKSRMHCVVVRIYRLFFMRIVCIITNIIQKLCRCEAILCDKISEIIVNETQLPALLLLQRDFGNGLGKNLLFRIFTTISYSETGRLCLAKIYLENFDKIYSTASKSKHIDSFITDLAHRFAASRTVLLYLVEGGLLSKILDLISKRLIELGFGQKDSILLVFSLSGSTRIDELYDALSKLHVMLYCPAPKFEATDRLIGELRNVGTRLVEFCLAFDDMEQIRNGYENLGRSIDSESVSFFILELHNLMVAYVIWIVTYGQIHNEVLELFLHVFQNHLKKSTANLSPLIAFERLVMHQDVENMQFSMFNLSKRVFFDLLTHSLVNNCLSPELKQSIFNDQIMLISISKSAITAFSFEVYYKAGHWINPSEYFDDLIFNYRHISFVHYFFMQDFVAVQILISCMNPTCFIKYLLFNFLPSIRRKLTLRNSFSSILSQTEYSDGICITNLMILVYNALTERHFVGNLEDPFSYLIERQIIHILAMGDISRTDLRNRLYMNRVSFESMNNRFNFMNIDEMLSKLPCVSPPSKSSDKYSLADGYLNTVNPFFFLNNEAESEEWYERLCALCESSHYKFELPQLVDLRPEFKGINDFLFSEAFSELIILIFQKWFTEDALIRNDSNILTMSLIMSLCFILKTSKDRCLYEQYKRNLDYLFGNHRSLGNRSLFQIITTQRQNIRSPVLRSMIDYFVGLMENVEETYGVIH